MTTPISVFQAARQIGQNTGWTLSNLQLQKIIYIAHMFCLGTRQKPLIYDNFEAWDYGPVVPALYHKVKAFGANPVKDVFFSSPWVSDPDTAKILSDAGASLSKWTPGQLVNFTHQSDGAWATYYNSGRKGAVIPDAAILAEFPKRFNV